MSEAGKVTARLELDDSDFQQRLRDGVSALKSVAPAAQDAASGVQSLGQKADAAAPQVGSLSRNLDKFTSSAGEVGRALTTGVTLPLAALAAGSIKAATDMEALKMGLTSVTGSAAATESQLVRLREIAKLPGLGFKEAVQGSVRLQAAGLSADLAEKSLKGFGNAIAAVGGGKAQLDSVTLALSQIAAAGKVTADNINQISNSAPQVRQMMKAAFGTSNTEELQAMGISAEEFVTKISTELAKLPPVGDTAKNSFETAGDEIEQSLAKIGDAALPLVATLLKDLVPAITGVADAFKSLPTGAQQAILVGGAIAASVGPAVGAVTGLIKTITALRGAMVALGALRVGGAAAGAVGAAEGGAALAGGAAAAGGATILGVAALPAAAAIAATVGVGLAAGYGIDQATGGRERDQRVKAANANLDAANRFNKSNSSDAQNERRKAAGLPYFDQSGKLIRPTPKTFTRDTSKQDEKNAKLGDQANDAEFAFRMQQAQNTAANGPEQFQAQRELKNTLPLITARRAELDTYAKSIEPLIKKDAEKAKEYWQNRRDSENLKQQGIKLEQDAAKEVAQNQKHVEAEAKKREQEAKQYRENVQRFQTNAFREQLAGAEASANARTEDKRAFARLEEVTPVIEARQRELLAQAKALEPLTRSSWEAVTERQERMSEIASLERQKQQMQRSALEEQERNEKKAAEDAKRNAEKAKQAMEHRASSLKQISDQMMDAFKRMNADRLGLGDAKMRLAEAELKNNPFLNDQQKKRAMLPLLEQQLRETLKPVQGETQMDTINRRIQAEGLKGQIVDSLGGFGRLGRRGAMMLQQQFGQLERESLNAPVTSRAVAEAQAVARQAAAATGKPTVLQMFLNGQQLNERTLLAFFQDALRKLNTESGMAGAAG